MIRSARLEAAVIVISGDSMVESAIGALRLGASDYLRKPYEVEVLLHAVRRVLQRRHLERTNREIARQLEQSETQHRFLVEASPDLIFTLDEEFRFTYVNHCSVELTGYAPRELQGQSILSVIVPQDVDKLRYSLERADSGQRNVEFRIFRNTDGSEERHFDAVLVPARFEAPRGALAGGFSSLVYGIARAMSRRASPPRIVWPTSPTTISSPGCPTGRSSATAWGWPWCRRGGVAARWRCSSSIWIASSWPTTPSAT